MPRNRIWSHWSHTSPWQAGSALTWWTSSSPSPTQHRYSLLKNKLGLSWAKLREQDRISWTLKFQTVIIILRQFLTSLTTTKIIPNDRSCTKPNNCIPSPIPRISQHLFSATQYSNQTTLLGEVGWGVAGEGGSSLTQFCYCTSRLELSLAIPPCTT